MKKYDKDDVVRYLKHTSEVYRDLKGPSLEAAICGGTALNLSGLLERPTKDVDVLSPEVWPPQFQEAINVTALRFGLNPNWMNRGPVDLLRMGLPEGYFSRCSRIQYHDNLVYLITNRLDQIYFKLYACIDRGGYHVQDLKILNPTEEELYHAALWCQTHDVSEGFYAILVDFMKKMGWNHVAAKLAK